MPEKIELQHVSYSYSSGEGQPIVALRDVNLELMEGEFIALIGENGAGKSTLARLLNALRLPEEGIVRVFGLDTRDSANHTAIRSQIGMVFQRPQDQVVGTTVEEDVAFGPANLGFSPREIRRRVEDSLAITGLQALAERPSYMLSAGETQRLALAGVLAMQPRCLIFDETTAMLDPYGRQMVLEQAHQLNRQGLTVVLITHLMEEAALTDRVIALQKGRVVLDGSPAQVFANVDQLRNFGLDLPPAAHAAITLKAVLPEMPDGIWQEKALLESLPQYDGRPLGFAARAPQEHPRDIILIKDLSYTYMRFTPLAHQALNRLSLGVAEGSVHGIIGPTGCGKSTLLQHINALLRPQAGRVETCGMDLADTHLDVRALRQQVALAFQQPEDQFFETFVGDEIAFGPKNLLDNPNLGKVVRAAMTAVGLDFVSFKDRRIAALSGGEKRKVALASVLASQPRVLLLDEPLAGLDPRSRTEIGESLQKLNRQGVTLVISTHQYEGLVEYLDAVNILKTGQDQLHGHPSDVFSHDRFLQAVNLLAPLAARLSWAFRKKGWPLPFDAVSLADLIKMLADNKGISGA